MRGPDSARVGAAIRKLRLSRGWTLAELSDQTSIPLSTLSRVELGQNALNNDKLIRLCTALEVDVQGLVAREADSITIASGRRSIVRAGEGRRVRLGAHAGRLAGGDLIDRSLTPIVLEIEARTVEEHGPMLVLPGEAYLLVLAGAATLHSQFYAPLALDEGDGIYFDGRGGHAILNSGAGPARVLLAIDGAFDPPADA